MGLMLSVLVFCVGVAEILDCWHHFLLHLVQPQYNPLPRHLDLKSDYLSDIDLTDPLPESRRTSHVDICWPRDLSPDDNLHVIKKRHGEIARGIDHDGELHRAGRKHLCHEKDSSFLPTNCENVEGISPAIVVDAPDSGDVHTNVIPRDTSPNRLELGVIVESDSSSDVEEPSQIENVNYKKQKDLQCVKQDEELSDLCDDGALPADELKESGMPRPTCPSAMIFEDECDNESCHESTRVRNASESSFSELPVFTENILSHDVMRVNVHHPTSALPLNIASSHCYAEGNIPPNAESPNDSKSIQSLPSEGNIKRDCNTDVQSISSILDEGLEPIPEFPEIKVMESSPVPQEDDSDSSLNTSDASWMVRSKTSDRPLVIRFHTSPDKVQKDFQSVVQTDLRALGHKEDQEGKGSPMRVLEKADSLDVYYDALVNQNGGESQGMPQNNSNLENVGNEERLNEADVKPSSVNFMQIDSNSSSSSLSGIPPLPEDALDPATQAPLATDNGFSQSIDMLSTDISYSHSDKPAICSLTNQSDQSDREKSHQASVETDNVKVELLQSQPIQRIDGENVCLDTSHIQVIPDINNEKTENTPGLEDNRQEKSDPEYSLNSIKRKEDNSAVTSECSKSDSRIAEEPPSSQSEPKAMKVDSLPQKSISCIEESEILSTSDEKITHSKDSESVHKLTKENESLSSNQKSNTFHELDGAQQSPSGSEAVASSSTDQNCSLNIPTELKEKPNESETKKETSLPTKKNSSKKQKVKSSSKASSTESSDTVVLCRPKTSEEEVRSENRAESVTVKTTSSNDPKISNAGPTNPTDDARPSTSKSEEDKSFWLIFSGEYTKAMNKDWHSGHFCCWQCDESLTGQRYVLRDEHPYCVKCYESVFANGCEECSKTIGIDSKDLSYKDKHWHEACFLCNKCRVSLVDKQFGSKLDKVFCGNCYDQQFASRCDGCGQIFKAGTKKMEYKTRQWHEPCFACCVCKSAIGTKSFIPREQEIYCATCYEEKFATRCVKCNKIITSGGVTYKNEPWHRECFTCTNCNTSLAGQRFTSRDEKPYCAECFGELFAKRCTACSKPITGIGGTRFISFEDRHWHNDCFICASCKTSLVGRGFITDADDIICPECAKQKLM